MGSVSLKIGDGTAQFKRSSLCPSLLHLLMLLSLLATNLFAFYAFTSRPTHHQGGHHHLQNISDHLSLILGEIDSSQKKLTRMENQLLGFEIVDPAGKPGAPGELKLFLRRHPLPLGKDSKTGITEMVSSVGHSCAGSAQLLSQFMSYKPGGPCPDDSALAQKLILQGCEPLPRRRCFTKSATKNGLLPLPLSLWKPVSEKLLSWSGFSCKNFSCLLKRNINNGPDFDLVNNGYEKQRWVKPRGKNDFTADDVLAMGGGGIRTGFDMNGGFGNFAAVMAEKNVTIITSALDMGAPYSEFVAARGLFPLFMSENQRFPFYDGVFDLVHAATGLWDGTQVEKMEFLMFDIDRILRANGLFWLDNYLCVNDESKNALTQLIDKFGYKKLRWVVGAKADSSGELKVYLSAVLQKPVRT